jgi:hypothetical protein
MRQGFINMSAGFFVTRHAICRLFFRLGFLPHLQIFCQRASTQQKYSPAYLFTAERREKKMNSDASEHKNISFALGPSLKKFQHESNASLHANGTTEKCSNAERSDFNVNVSCAAVWPLLRFARS